MPVATKDLSPLSLSIGSWSVTGITYRTEPGFSLAMLHLVQGTKPSTLQIDLSKRAVISGWSSLFLDREENLDQITVLADAIVAALQPKT